MRGGGGREEAEVGVLWLRAAVVVERAGEGGVPQAVRDRDGLPAAGPVPGARTSSKNAKVRLLLLLVGIALALLNVWALLHAELLASGPRGKRQPHLHLLRLTLLRILILLEILRPSEPQWQTQQPIPDSFAAIV